MRMAGHRKKRRKQILTLEKREIEKKLRNRNNGENLKTKEHGRRYLK